MNWKTKNTDQSVNRIHFNETLSCVLIKGTILPSRMAFSKSFRVSSTIGRIFFCCEIFCGVMSLPPAKPLFKSPFASGLKAFVDGLISIGGGGGGGGGATEFDAICLGDS